jgi:hypothetical protein
MGLHELGELPFEMRIGRWQIDLPTATARGVVNGVVLTATLSALGEASIPATVLSVVVPAIFDVERVSISPSQRYVYAVLLNAPVATQQDTLSVEQWYARLPARVQAELTLLEFRDIVGVLDEMGNVDLDTHGHLKVVRPSPRRVARLRLPAAPPPYEFQ